MNRVLISYSQEIKKEREVTALLSIALQAITLKTAIATSILGLTYHIFAGKCYIANTDRYIMTTTTTSFLHPHILYQRMNACGRENTPFLFAIDFELSESIFVPHPLQQQEILFRTPLGGNTPLCKELKKQTDTSIIPHPEPYERYLKRFRIVREGLLRGDSFLVNLTLKTPIETTLSLKEIFELSNAPYCLYLPERFACFSPERFVHIARGRISTNPMKGTINASIPGAEELILHNAKERAEHSTVVDLLRNDLGMVAAHVAVERFRYVDRITTAQRDILQVSSEISGRLPQEGMANIGSIIGRMLPAGSVSGAPKPSTLQIIRRAEEEPRGFYTGVFGYFDGHSLDSGVLIRYIEKQHDTLYFRSGGGITAFSNPESEYKEAIEKIYLTCHTPNLPK